MHYIHIYTINNLWFAWSKVQRKPHTSAGVDRIKVNAFAAHAEQQLQQLQTELQERHYRPLPLRFVRVPKNKGSKETRTLVIPALRDRVAQHATLNIIHPHLNQKLTQACFAYRPGLSVIRALCQVLHYRKQGYNHVVRLDVQAYFDRIPQAQLAKDLPQWIQDPGICKLLMQWVEQSPYTPLGIPQGAVVSPLLANMYLHQIDRSLMRKKTGLVRYADDLVILCRDPVQAEETLLFAKALLLERGLNAHPVKTHLTSFKEGFDFLGAHFKGTQVYLPDWLMPHAERLGGGMSLSANQNHSQEVHAMSKVPVHAPEPQAPVSLESPVRTLYIQEQGSQLHLQAGRFVLTKSSTVLHSLPSQAVDQIVVMGTCGITAAVIRYALTQQIPIYYLT
jgi:CRISPR-associated protein Cas1